MSNTADRGGSNTERPFFTRTKVRNSGSAAAGRSTRLSSSAQRKLLKPAEGPLLPYLHPTITCTVVACIGSKRTCVHVRLKCIHIKEHPTGYLQC